MKGCEGLHLPSPQGKAQGWTCYVEMPPESTGKQRQASWDGEERQGPERKVSKDPERRKEQLQELRGQGAPWKKGGEPADNSNQTWS